MRPTTMSQSCKQKKCAKCAKCAKSLSQIWDITKSTSFSNKNEETLTAQSLLLVKLAHAYVISPFSTFVRC